MKVFAFIIAIGVSITSFGQDVHFSQMEYSPLNLNPALAGANAPAQAIVNYRSQWKSVASPYNTIAASFDGRFNEKSRNKAGIIAGGLNFHNDVAGDNKVTELKVNANLAYHLILDQSSMIGLGIYGGFGQRSIGISDAQWGSQYVGGAYNPSAGNGELLDNNQLSFLDAGAGLVYTYNSAQGYATQNNQRLLNGGIAFYHVNTPSYSFNGASSEDLYLRWSVFFNGTIGLSNSNAAIAPGIYFNKQGPATEVLYGAYYRITLTEGSQITGRIKPFYFHIGLFHRWNDALVAKSILEWHTMSAGFAYDINISPLNRASKMKGGFEVFLRYKLEPGAGSRSQIR